MRPYRFFAPAILIIAPVLLSFLVWAVPGESLRLRGFDARTPLEIGGVLLLVAWYAGVILVAVLGAKAGRAVSPPRFMAEGEVDSSFNIRAYAIFSAAALIGIVGTYAIIQRDHDVIGLILASRTNELSDQFQSGSSIATLRYATVVAAPVGLFLWLKNPRSWILAVSAAANAVLLILSALLSSRLSLLMALVVFAYLYFHSRPEAKLRVWPILAIGAVVGGLLTVFSYVRTAGFYRSMGVENPLEMAFYQFASYLGAPPQVSLGVANGVMSGRFSVPSDFLYSLSSLLPTFLQFGEAKDDRSRTVGPAEYGFDVNISSSLNANSVFADTYASLGLWGLVFTLFGLALAAFLLGHSSRYSSVVAAGGGVAAYVLIETWRAYLFNSGMVIFLLLLVAGGGVVAALWPRLTELIRSKRRGSAVGAEATNVRGQEASAI